MMGDVSIDRPVAIAPNPTNIPAELKSLPQWVVWMYEPPSKPASKWRKIPYTPYAKRASTSDPKTWRDYSSALSCYQAGGYDGIGFVFKAGGGLVGMDVDNCRDPETGVILEWVRKFIAVFDSYSEVSVSGVGIHLLIRASFPQNEQKRQGHIEMYQEGRFFTMTGCPVHARTTIESRDAALEELRAKIFVKPATVQTGAVSTLTYKDAQILELAARETNGPAFQALYGGDAETSGRYLRSDGTVDLSRADYGLLGYLKHYTRDPEQLERLMRGSKLNRPKWDERRGTTTWIAYTIDRSLREQGDFAPSAPIHHNGNRKGGLTPEPDTTAEQKEAPEEDEESTTQPDDAATDEELPRPRYILHHVSEAFQPQPPIPWVIEGMLACGSVALFVGTGGSKKTYSLLDLAACVANGLPWLKFPTVQGPVLVIDEESGDRRLKHRFMEVMRAHEASELTPIWYTTIAGFNLRNPVDVAHVSGLIEQVQPSLVIMDALVDLMPGGDENAAQDVHPVFHALRQMAEHYQCAIIVVHHSGKSGEYRGSTSMHGAVDLMLMVKSPPKEKYVVFETVKVRDTEDLKFTAIAEWDSVHKTFTLTSVSAAPRAAKFSVSELYVLGYLQKAPHRRASLLDIANQADTCSEEMARKATRRLTERGYVRRCDHGGPGERAIYELTSQTTATEGGTT